MIISCTRFCAVTPDRGRRHPVEGKGHGPRLRRRRRRRDVGLEVREDFVPARDGIARHGIRGSDKWWVRRPTPSSYDRKPSSRYRRSARCCASVGLPVPGQFTQSESSSHPVKIKRIENKPTNSLFIMDLPKGDESRAAGRFAGSEERFAACDRTAVDRTVRGNCITKLLWKTEGVRASFPQ